MTDRLLRGATVVDGTGAPRYSADVLLRGDRIDRIAPAIEASIEPDAEVWDAAGLVLAPGFIDMHAHSDLAVLADPVHLAKVSQGVTTEVIGQDGIGYAPVDDAVLPALRRQIAGWNGHPELDVDWRSMGEYLDRLARGTALNTAVLVPQGNLRLLAVGSADRPATAAEIDRMRGILADSLAAGAVGMSSGLTYVPGMYADSAELAALCRVVAEAGGYYAPHTRSYGAGALAAYTEMIDIARDTGCALHLTHATLNFASNADAAPRFLELIDAALADGVDVTLDTYPYLPGATTLVALLPSWIAAGGIDALRDRLAAGRDRDALVRALDVDGCDGFHGERADWTTIQISGVSNPVLASLVGRTIAEIAAETGEEPVDAVIRILLSDDLATGVLMHIGHEQNVQTIMRHPVHTGGSDGILVGDRPHPRAWGTFPRYLGRYVRELGVLSLEEAIRHLCGTPARRLRMRDRGLVREGFVADLVLFDPLRVLDRATFDQPRRTADGIAAVFVGGELAYRDGERTDSRSGRSLRMTKEGTG
ncbi:N-acyl-D-amino-acid deacylase family protein [Microbacterium sp. ASV49]|uniref:D-aminoacylase n=1 Tax=Microbacterium candidum TaxID=3041922 RepID=A0ABT7MVN5_9MICO|nr:D-aminoacylase [Microbacterium sp. ASV49]MDL9978520.1 D-aminoacylase [Microbacterium sp. ASV49]